MQNSFIALAHNKKLRCEKFLDEMNEVIPWKESIAIVEPYYEEKVLGRKNNPRPRTKEFAFTGLLRCGECGCTITAEEHQKRLKNGSIVAYTYYHCSKSKNHKLQKPCKQKAINLSKLEKQIVEFLSALEVPASYVELVHSHLLQETDEEIEAREKIRKSLQKSSTSCDTELNNLLRMKLSDNDILSDEEFKTQKQNLMKEKQQIIEQLESLDKRQSKFIDLTVQTFQFATIARQKFQKGTLEEKKLILRCVGSELILNDGKLSIEPRKVFQVIANTAKNQEAENARLGMTNNRSAKGKSASHMEAKKLWLPKIDAIRRFFQEGNVLIWATTH